MIICVANEEQKRNISDIDMYFPITSKFDDKYIQDMTQNKNEVIEKFQEEVIAIVSLYGENEEIYRMFQEAKEESYDCKLITFVPDTISKEERKRMKMIADIIITFSPTSGHIKQEIWKHAYTLLSMSESNGFIPINSKDIRWALRGHEVAHSYSLPLFQAKQKEEVAEKFQTMLEQTHVKETLQQANVILVNISADTHYSYKHLDAMTEYIYNRMPKNTELCMQFSNIDEDRNGEIEVNMIMN